MLWLLVPVVLSFPAGAGDDALLQAMRLEVKREMSVLKAHAPPLYYLAYRAEQTEVVALTSTMGSLSNRQNSKVRRADTILRVGSPQLDNQHEMKKQYDFAGTEYGNIEFLPVEDDVQILQRDLWRLTQRVLRGALERYKQVASDEAVRAESEDPSPDYTLIKGRVSVKAGTPLTVDSALWEDRINKASSVFREFPGIYGSSVGFSAEQLVKYFVDSEGVVLRHPNRYFRVYISAETQSDDGMALFLHESFAGLTLKDLPKEPELVAAARRLAERLIALRNAPAIEPYVGPAIFMNRATGVFFHEVMGHRLEGHRQKSEKEGQTFTKKVGKRVLPGFIDLLDDPARSEFKGIPLLGHYRYDDEGVKAATAVLVENGILKGFIMSRSPIAGFLESNGHGRGEIGAGVVARQANLIVQADEGIPYAELRKMLLSELKTQGKPYGLIFEDISGGFTMTSRWSPQAFKVLPLVVYRVYADGRPDELVRGADIVGTPLTVLEKILAAGDDYDVFNGQCGAESGYVPVSAVAPSVLVKEIEVEKSIKNMERPPILSSPMAGGAG